ncbi:MAG: glycerophosphodiester phosphodiesterase family protein [Actinomycetaceae bacterium]|nr:glycerophosphodiester phosphodiesterase family protein [Actinomycetaceae bacterium]
MTTPFYIYAHRGGSCERDENTWEAVEYTASLPGIRLETDVRLTKDGKVILFHDPYVERVLDGNGYVNELTWYELSKMRSPNGCRPALLSDVLEAFPQMHINIDAKEDAVVDPLGKLIHRFDAVERVTVASFSHKRLHRLRNYYMLYSSLSQYEIALLELGDSIYTKYAKKIGHRHLCQAAQVPLYYKKLHIASRRFIKAAHRVGLEVHVWTVNDEHLMTDLIGRGVDGIITDAPQLCRKVYRSRAMNPEGNSINGLGKKTNR